MERYNDGTEPLESWTTEDLADLEFLVNAELQERYYRMQGEYDREWDSIDPYHQR